MKLERGPFGESDTQAETCKGRKRNLGKSNASAMGLREKVVGEVEELERG